MEEESDDVWESANGGDFLVNDNLKDQLRSAMSVRPGQVANVHYWDELLGLNDAKPGNPLPQGPARQLPAGIGMSRPPANAARPAPVGDVSLNRPRRPTKKRRYNDDSFEGYGEGYDDDDVGQSPDEDSGNRKRRKQVLLVPV